MKIYSLLDAINLTIEQCLQPTKCETTHRHWLIYRYSIFDRKLGVLSSNTFYRYAGAFVAIRGFTCCITRSQEHFGAQDSPRVGHSVLLVLWRFVGSESNSFDCRVIALPGRN